mgnify:CR=1 FL=1
MPCRPRSVTCWRARAAQRIADGYDQQRVDELVAAAGWAIVEPARNRELAELAVADTGIGDAADKLRKNQRKTLGLLRDLAGVKSVGVIAEDAAKGIVEIARPVGVVCAITPSTNPAATPANKIINALKGRNAVIVAPSPKGWSTAQRLIEFIHAQFERIGAPRDLVQLLPAPIDKASTAELMRQCDLVVATGSQANVRAAYTCGTPAFGVGAGNVAGIVDETANVDAAAERVLRSKTFDNATSCSSENSLVLIGSAREPMLAALRARGRALGLLGLAEFERGLFLRPDNLAGGVDVARERLGRLGLGAGATVFIARGLEPSRERQARALWDGAALTRQALPARGAALFKVWGSAADDVWLSGEAGTLWHWDGGGFAAHHQATPASILTVAGCGRDEAYAVGGSHLWQWDGAAWREDTALPAAALIAGVACGRDDVLVVGAQGLRLRRPRGGGAWIDERDASVGDLHGAWAPIDEETSIYDLALEIGVALTERLALERALDEERCELREIRHEVPLAIAVDQRVQRALALADLTRDCGQIRGRARELADFCLIAPGSATSTIQELHIVMAHTLCECVEAALFEPA